jgi:hypothetical protein
MEFRTKKTVEAGIAKDIQGGSNTRLLDYQPGNGTRYPVMVTMLTPAQAQLLGYGAGCAMVTIQRFYPDRFLSRPFYVNGFIRVSEVKESFEFNGVNDACCIAELLGDLLACETDADEVASSTLAQLAAS